MLRSAAREARSYWSAPNAHQKLNAFVKLAAPDAVINNGIKPRNGTLSGSLVAIKDNICTFDLPTSAASRALDSFTSPFDATVVGRLRDAGATIVGKTNMDEFGMGSHSCHSHYGPVYQQTPGGVKRSAGGSSGGSAVAVATGQCHAALGTDTGGSVRLPAAYNGVFGFKPSYGLLSRWGVIAYANSLDTVGIFSEIPEQVQEIFSILNHHDPKDPTSLSESTRSQIRSTLESSEDKPLSSLRIGVPLEYNIAELAPSVREAWCITLRLLQSLSVVVVPVSLPNTRHALSAYYVLAPAEASSNLAKYDGIRYGFRADGPDKNADTVLYEKTRSEAFGDEVKRRILLGAYTLSSEAIDNYFIQAQKVRRLVQNDFDDVFRAQHPLLDSSSNARNATPWAMDDLNLVDLLLCPTAPSEPPTLEEISSQSPVSSYVNDVFTVPASLAGLPALSMPVTRRRGKSEQQYEATRHIGMQLIGQFGDDTRVLKVAKALYDHLV